MAVFHHLFLWVLFPIVSVWLAVYVFFYTQFWWLVCAYSLWFIYDFDTPRRGSRRWLWYKNAAVWRYLADYFPIDLVRTVELSPEHNYIMGCHPHGVFSIGVFVHLCTNGTGFSELFPGLESTVLTLNIQFWFPFRRELGIALGGTDSSGASLKYLLENPGRGRIVGIVIGGSEEMLDAKPGSTDLNLMGRKGFCKYALKTGAHLVPSYSFGENDVFDQVHGPRGSKLRKIQTSIKKRFGFCPPLIIGRNFWGKIWGILPFRRPITTVVGAPIRIEKPVFEPTTLQIDALHTEYCQALTELFEKHKVDYGIGEDVHLNLY